MTKVMTVKGPLDAAELGRTLPHEHIFLDLTREFLEFGLLNDFDLMATELSAFREQGGATIIDVTPADLGRDPALLQAISERTGVNIVMGCGHYRNPYIDKDRFDRLTVDEIAEGLVNDIQTGADGTGIRAGIIGEIGCDRQYISASEERSFRAAARAHRQTDLTITTHASRAPVGMVQLDLLGEEGVDPRRVIIGHCDTYPDPEYHLGVARRGAFVQFDCIRAGVEYDVQQRVEFVMRLVRAGWIDSILLSHDVCRRTHLTILGGAGYQFIFGQFRERLEHAGLKGDEFDRIVIDNPRRALTGTSE